MSSNSGVLKILQSWSSLMVPPVPQSSAPPHRSTINPTELRLEFVGGEFGGFAEGTG